jgi:hypothetical protein
MNDLSIEAKLAIAIRLAELIDEIKGLRADLIAGKIAVNIDGQKVTSNVGKVVSRISSNSYAKV